jgi:putative protease
MNPLLRHPKPELLAPAGREDVYHAVIAAGADAVYLSGKQFNMRRHRKDFNFSPGELRRVCEHAHALGRRIYVTVNSLVGHRECAELKAYLFQLADLSPDALIVQDFAVVQLCREHRLPLALHASTMMNVGSAEAARFLRTHGFTRVVTSRDITVQEARRIRDEAGIEVEYFVHGDLCSVQSGQCLASGLMFGKSSNRGQCLKPCRWDYTLQSATTGQSLGTGHLLASKDLCLVQHLPELIQAGIDSLKIEGRMKPADVLTRIVGTYRAALDRLCNNPLEPAKLSAETALFHQNRIRDFSTGFAFRQPGPDFFDVSGGREVVTLSTVGSLPGEGGRLAGEQDPSPLTGSGVIPEITCVAGTEAVARAAIEAGARNVVLSWEGDLRSESAWSLAALRALVQAGTDGGVRIILASPRIVTERELREWRTALAVLPSFHAVCISHFALLDTSVPHPGELWADNGLNALNPAAAAFLTSHGVARLVPGLEASLDDVLALAGAPGVAPLELLVHGPLTGMIVEHCLPAMATQRSCSKDFCQMPCAGDTYRLVDARGTSRRLRCDRYCRNHLLMERDLGLLPALDAFRAPDIASWRIDARLETPERAATLIDLYRRAAVQNPISRPLADEFLRACPADTLTWGAYPRGIMNDQDVSLVEIKQAEHHESQRPASH